MQKLLSFALLLCLGLSGCASEKLVYSSSGWIYTPLSTEGDAYGFGPLEEGEVFKFYIENQGTGEAFLDLLLHSDETGEASLYKAIRLGVGEKRLVALKPSYDSEGKGLVYMVKLVRGSEAKIFFHDVSYKPEGSYDQTEAEWQKEVESTEGLVRKEEIFPISEKTAKNQVSFELEPGVKHFSIAYEGKAASETEVRVYRASDNSLIMSGKALPSIRLNSENTFTLNGQNEAFYVVLKELEYKPLEGELIVSFHYKD